MGKSPYEYNIIATFDKISRNNFGWTRHQNKMKEKKRKKLIDHNIH
jgi:hypothetical protein